MVSREGGQCPVEIKLILQGRLVIEEGGFHAISLKHSSEQFYNEVDKNNKYQQFLGVSRRSPSCCQLTHAHGHTHQWVVCLGSHCGRHSHWQLNGVEDTPLVIYSAGPRPGLRYVPHSHLLSVLEPSTATAKLSSSCHSKKQCFINPCTRIARRMQMWHTALTD